MYPVGGCHSQKCRSVDILQKGFCGGVLRLNTQKNEEKKLFKKGGSPEKKKKSYVGGGVG